MDSVMASTFRLHGFRSVLCRHASKDRRVTFINKALSDPRGVSLPCAEVLMAKILKLNWCLNIYAICKPRNSNLASFFNEVSQFLNCFNNILLADSFNIDVMSTAQPGVYHYISVLLSYTFEKVISDFTRDEIMENKIAAMYIDDFVVEPGIIREKVADFTAVTILTEGQYDANEG